MIDSPILKKACYYLKLEYTTDRISLQKHYPSRKTLVWLKLLKAKADSKENNVKSRIIIGCEICHPYFFN